MSPASPLSHCMNPGSCLHPGGLCLILLGLQRVWLKLQTLLSHHPTSWSLRSGSWWHGKLVPGEAAFLLRHFLSLPGH